MSTFTPKTADIHRAWLEVDATGMTLGRLGTEVASRLRGKHKAIFTPHVDTGDHVIIINAAKVVFKGNKLNDKVYYHHTGFPGGIKAETARKRLARRPEKVIETAIKGMLPKSKLGRAMGSKLKVYVGTEHPHGAQLPQPLTVENK